MKELLPLRGIVTVLNAPFTDDDCIDADSLRRNVAIASMKQSKRSRLPHIAPLSTFETILSSGMVYDLCLVASETERKQGLRTLCANRESVEKILVLVGPEAGFSPVEIDLARASRFQTVSLGPRRLRTETAGILVVALLAYEFGEIHDL